MKKTDAALLLTFLIIAGCLAQPTATPTPTIEPTATPNPTPFAVLGQPVTLAIGQTIPIQGQDAALTFSRVITDSRCPRGVLCKWAGLITVEARLDHDGQNETAQLIIGAITDAKKQVGPYTIELIGVEPYPQHPNPINPDDYRARFQVENRRDQAYSRYCQTDSDCVLEIQLQPQCSHPCFGDQCPPQARLCQAYDLQSAGNQALANAQCKQNEACRMPNQVTCIQNRCQVS